MAFVKLDRGILDSTLWFGRDVRDVFVTALLMAEPYELKAKAAQLEIDSAELTGWIVPPGWYGFVAAAGIGIIRRAGLDDEHGRNALRQLGAPEGTSRSPEFDGRRMVRVDGGFIILNYVKYRDRDVTAAERQKRWRERQMLKGDAPTPQPRDVTGVTSRVISNEERKSTEVQSTEKEEQEREKETVPPSTGNCWQDWREEWEADPKRGILRLTPKATELSNVTELCKRYPDDNYRRRLMRGYFNTRNKRILKEAFSLGWLIHWAASIAEELEAGESQQQAEREFLAS